MKIVLAKFHENWLRIHCEIGEKHALQQVNVTFTVPDLYASIISYEYILCIS